MRTKSLVTHSPWSVLVELRFAIPVTLPGAGSKAAVHYVEADAVEWEADGRDGAIRLRLLRGGESAASCTVRLLLGIRLLAVPPPGSRTRARWLPDEEERLRGELELDTPPAGIARLLGRSERAVHSHLAASPALAAVAARIPHPRSAR